MLVSHRICCAFLFAILLCGTSAFAQKQFGSAQGTVRDREGLGIPGAIVVASSGLRGIITVFTESNGRYRIEALIPGNYELKAQLPGFQSITKTEVRISVGNTSTIDFVLEPEKLAESVIVEEETPQIDSTTTAISHAVPPEIVHGLPDVGIRTLMALTPGVGDDGIAYGASNTSNRLVIDEVQTGEIFKPGITRFLFQTHTQPRINTQGIRSSKHYFVSSDGTHFLINTLIDNTTPTEIHVVLNWKSLLKQ